MRRIEDKIGRANAADRIEEDLWNIVLKEGLNEAPPTRCTQYTVKE
jgi:hypothetical protein